MSSLITCTGTVYSDGSARKHRSHRPSERDVHADGERENEKGDISSTSQSKLNSRSHNEFLNATTINCLIS